jgi:hypothetical protein
MSIYQQMVVQPILLTPSRFTQGVVCETENTGRSAVSSLLSFGWFSLHLMVLK